MPSQISDYVEAAIRVAREDDRLLRIDETAEKIATAVGRPDRVDYIAEALLQACVEHGITVEIERARSPQPG